MSPISKLCEKIISNESFVNDFRLLETKAASNRVLRQELDISSEMIERLLMQSSVFAFSEEVFHKHTAQKILSILHELYPGNVIINYAIQVICARLGNFPVVGLESEVFKNNNLFQKLTSDEETDFIIDPDIASGLLVEEEVSRFDINDKVFHFNTFQNEILKALDEKILISFSAPTSFGKSFIVRHYIARRFAFGTIKRCLIVVPTKSLIDDFFDDFTRIRKNLSLDFALYTHARSVDQSEERGVFILTQERLSFLIAQNPDFVKTFDLVYCDEAHSIARGYRGFILREVLRNLISICNQRSDEETKTKYVFSSPIIKNPDYYQQKLFQHLDENQTYHKEIKYSPVEKNVHLIQKNEDNFEYYLLHDLPKEVSFDSQIEQIGSKSFGQIDAGNLTDIAKDVHIVLNSNLKGRTIFFNTSPINAHKYGLLLAQGVSNKEGFSNEIADLEKYIQDHFDKSFGVAELLKKGIGLHYGPMPIGLRRAMVGLFEKGAIDYLICTPTLLEGVNLPAKNIFLFSDKYGGRSGTEKHNPLSFWNLLGRAGRITFGLSGNVYCVEKSIQKYENLFENKEVEIQDPENEVVDDRTRKNYLIATFLEANEEDRFAYLRSTSRDSIEYLIFELLTKANPEHLLEKIDPEVRSRILQSIEQIKSGFQIPNSVISLSPGIDPRLQDKLYVATLNMSDDSISKCFEWISNPLATGADDFSRVLGVTSRNLSWPKSSDISKIASRLTQWIHEYPLSGFIQQYVQHLARPTDIPSQILFIESALSIIRDLEKQFSYSAPKYLKCLLDMIIESANQKGMDTSIYKEKAESFLFTLECGVSSFIGRYLYEKGIARPIAIKANSLIEDLATIPLTDDFFSQPNVIARLKSGMSKIAYDELMDHLNIEAF